MKYWEDMFFGRAAETGPERAAAAIADDLSGRRGFDIDDLDEEIHAEIADAWVQIIRVAMATKPDT